MMSHQNYFPNIQKEKLNTEWRKCTFILYILLIYIMFWCRCVDCVIHKVFSNNNDNDSRQQTWFSDGVKDRISFDIEFLFYLFHSHYIFSFSGWRFRIPRCWTNTMVSNLFTIRWSYSTLANCRSRKLTKNSLPFMPCGRCHSIALVIALLSEQTTTPYAFMMWTHGTSRPCVNTFAQAHSGAEIFSVTFSRNGKYLLLSDKDSLVKLCELSTSRCLIAYTVVGTTASTNIRRRSFSTIAKTNFHHQQLKMYNCF
jgi:WD40 repeat protein